MKKRLTSLILASLMLVGTIGIMRTALSEDPPELGMITEISTLSSTSEDPPIL